MTDNVLALYFIVCGEIHHRGVDASAAFDVARDLWARMTPEQQAETFDVVAEMRRLIDEKMSSR